ncbi:replication factor C subunit 1, putative [Plasmodium yoelii]|uniref:Replication factor C subunit 1 n=3 Tax=Plasmodium yoelii TaxID=5861 RepID=A0AAF0B2U7_PLAYO|nr:replication factor C subunit 1, putative [Plasmodium yoelii]EAA16369.1 replication factor C, 140 kDa subunit [Plasmodium yoelii yoelii]WBY55095.1 replication factor C subunit 1 [Plasmodium yoelii yoelii]CDU16351.1 replication factor C subunit 1, putative [Plasmodium yoelii]VTZ72659.1 replication factor C subunit 1, putative [Plasmodium yoelii]|eukprot:XP_724804.1 replication factor C subunit 1, putative [Plasmodium yoelii]
MSSKEKNLFSDNSSDEGRKKKRLKKISSNLFDDEDQNMLNNSDAKSVVEIKDESDEELTKGASTTNNKTNQIFKKNASKKNAYYDISSYFKPVSKNSGKEQTGNISNTNNQSKKIPLENVDEYFSIIETGSKKVTSNSKRERSHDSDLLEQNRSKKKHISTEDNNILQKNETNVSQNFDYLPFINKKFVLTGVFKTYSRDDLQNKIKEHGGSVMSAVSSRTHYLVHGEYLEDGRLYSEGKKYQKAYELSKQSKSIIKILNEEELLQMFPNQQSNTEQEKNGQEKNGQEKNGQEKNGQEKNGPYQSVKHEQEQNMPYQSVKTGQEQSVKKVPQVLNQLWVDKYKPTKLEDLVGNTQNVFKLKTWLSSWDDVCIKGLKKQVTKTFRGNFENINAKCALLSGPAGIGKTTTAKIVSMDSGYNVIEFNASDERNKAAVEKISEMATGGYSITSLNNKSLKKTCIIMDEVDGMSSGDKGGSSAILKLIEKTKCPIICICNDRQNSKMRTLANKCYDLKFTTPNKNSVVKRLLEICKNENLMMEPNALELLWESSNGDIRQILNALQLLSKTYKRIQFLDIKKDINNSNKNVQSLANPFEITLKLLNFHESSKLKIREIMDLFFVDYELIPYFISENYTNIFNDNDKSNNPMNKWNTFAQISYDLSLAEKIKYNLKTTMDYSLLPHFSILSCVCPVMRIRSLKSFMQGRINFPSAFGKISTFNKNKRLLNELCFNLSYKLNVYPKYMITSGFLNYIYYKIIVLLQKNNINDSIQLMEQYNITKEMLIENIPSLRLPTQENLYDKLDSKTKASFTRQYNSIHVVKNDPNAVKKSLKSIDKKSSYKNNEDEIDEDMDDFSDSKEDKDDDVLVKAKLDKKNTTKNKLATKPKASKKK